MDIQKLKENRIEETIDYRGEIIKLELSPDVYTSDDAGLKVAEYVAKGLRSWDITDKGDPLVITPETLSTVIPDALLTVIFDRILTLKEAGMGKLKTLKT